MAATSRRLLPFPGWRALRLTAWRQLRLAGNETPKTRPTAKLHAGVTCAQEEPRDRPEKPRSESDGLAIVFTHRSNSDYLAHSLAQARSSNPDSTVYLLGDETNADHEGVEHVLLSDLHCDQTRELAKRYQHFNSTGYESELFNLQRWFVLRNFMLSAGLARCLYLDSDVMLYANATIERQKFANFDLTLSRYSVPCTVYVNECAILDEFARFVLDIYGGALPYEFDCLVARYALLHKNGAKGGACDMTAFELFHDRFFDRIGEVSLVNEGSVYDPGLDVSTPGMVMDQGQKKVVWRRGVPYGIETKSGDEIRFCTLHFAGLNHKRLMRDFLSEAH